MAREVEHIDTHPDIIPARVNIHHLQLRDLLQPTGVKDKVLFVSRLQVEQADFTSLKQPSVYCTLDFQPNCLTTGCGLLAAGGQHGELALRPLHSPSSGAPHLQLDSSYPERPPAPWLLRTPTGGSINNAITIQPDLNHPLASRAASSTSHGASSASPSKPDLVDESPPDSYTPWARDEPSSSFRPNVARPGSLFGDQEMESELYESVFEELAAAYGFDSSSVNRSSRWRRSPQLRAAASTSRSTSTSTSTNASNETLVAPIKIMVSNNDQSIKLYRLRPPKSTPGSGGRIESGLPGLSRNTTLQFPTAINHSSLSPDQRTLIAVGDTPEVFIHSVSRTGEHVKVATYNASSDACFSTSWSPDGTKFAVASQDGVVSVWDVRSSRRLAAVSTSQPAGGSGSGAARTAKFSPDGRFLAFTEHRNFFHVADTVTFEETQRIAVPTGGAGCGEARETVAVSGRRAFAMGEGGDRFRLRAAGGEESSSSSSGSSSVARERTQAALLRDWNRGANPGLDSNAPGTTSTTTTSSSTSGVRASNYFPEWLINASSTTSTVRRAELLSAALRQSEAEFELQLSHLLSASGPGGGAAGGLASQASVNISGMCWDPQTEHLYISTERLIAKYTLADPRIAVANATLL